MASVINTQSGNSFYRFSNTDGKVWLMPAKNMQVAMSLYQPSGIKGKLMKLLFPYLHQIRLVRNIIKAERIKCCLPEKLKLLLASLFQVDDFEFAFFCGSPGPRQKMTIQIYAKNKILGYVKTSKDKDIIRSFQKESNTLNLLKSRGIKNIPEILYCDKLENDNLFIQSTTKTIHSKVINHLTDKHILLVRQFFELTRNRMPFKSTDLYSNILYLKSIFDSLNPHDKATLTKSTHIIEIHYNGEVEFGFMHGDFTPWNIYEENGMLYAFDFEYSGYNYPPFMDIVHFVLQTSILVKNLTIEETFCDLREKEHLLPVGDSPYLVLAYLLQIFSHYFKLFNGKFSTQDRSYKMWIGLMDEYNKIL